MGDLRFDQAEGLRRILGREAARRIMLVSAHGGVGKTQVAIHLAMALAAEGERVLLVDENRGGGNVSARLGLPERQALEFAEHETRPLHEAMVPTACGMTVLSAAGIAHALPTLGFEARERLSSAWAYLQDRFDVVLVDANGDFLERADALPGAGQDVILVSNASRQSVTDTYALIKRLNQDRRHRFHVLLNRVAREDDARIILRNLADVARRYLRVPVNALGYLPLEAEVPAVAGDWVPAMPALSGPASAAQFRRMARAVKAWPDGHERPGLIDRFMRHVYADRPPTLASAGV